MTEQPISPIVLNKMKELIIKSKKENIEYSAMVLSRLVKITSGAEYQVEVFGEGVPIFHTHVYHKPLAATADILEMVQSNRPSTYVGSLATFSNIPIVNCYELDSQSRDILRKLINKIAIRDETVGSWIKGLNITLPLLVTTYKFYRKWNSTRAVLNWKVGYTAPGGRE